MSGAGTGRFGRPVDAAAAVWSPGVVGASCRASWPDQEVQDVSLIGEQRLGVRVRIEIAVGVTPLE
jgi:hypothetical protein